MERHHAPQAHGMPAGPEKRDINVRFVLWSGVGIALLMAATFALFVPYFKVETAALPSAEKTPFSDARPLPPAPRLQQTPWGNLADFNNAQNTAMRSYGWVDKQNGIVHIPVERAIELTLQRGFKARPEGAPPVTVLKPETLKSASAAPAPGAGDAHTPAAAPREAASPRQPAGPKP